MTPTDLHVVTHGVAQHLSISTTPSGALVAEDDVRDLVERVTGRISFEEYMQRARRSRAG